MEKWPNFFIVGAPRCGTTSLHEYLKKIPRVFMSKIKEPEYFSPNSFKMNQTLPIYDKKEYLALFQEIKDELAIGESSTSYLEDPESPQLIHKVVPNARIIVLLRDPIERAYSHYLIHVRYNFEKQSFHDALGKILKRYDPLTSNHYLHAGLYSKQILRYINTFGKKNIKILIFEEFIQNKRKAVQEVLSFLEIVHNLKDINNDAFNISELPKGKFANKILHSKKIKKIAGKLIPDDTRQIFKEKLLLSKEKPQIMKEDRNILRDFFKDDVKELKNILDRDLPWLNFVNYENNQE